MSGLAQSIVEQIRAAHLVIEVKVPGRWRKQRVCALCQQPDPCGRRVFADDIEAGRRDIAGRPL